MSKILIVDDDPGMLRVLVRCLAQKYDVDCANGPRAALDLMGKKAYHLVITDWDMPDGGGQCLVEACQKGATPAFFGTRVFPTPVIVHTGDVLSVLKDFPNIKIMDKSDSLAVKMHIIDSVL